MEINRTTIFSDLKIVYLLFLLKSSLSTFSSISESFEYLIESFSYESYHPLHFFSIFYHGFDVF